MAVFTLDINISPCDVSVKRAGDPKERMLSYDEGRVTFQSVNDGFYYDYIVVISCEGIGPIVRSFSFRCNKFWSVNRCSDEEIFWTDVPPVLEEQVYSGPFDYYIYNGNSNDFFGYPEDFVVGLEIYDEFFAGCNLHPGFSLGFSLGFNS